MKRTLVVTSILPPTDAMAELAAGSKARGVEFLCVGDEKSPADYALESCRFLDLRTQLDTGFTLARRAPAGHYARKNIGYLAAIAGGSGAVIETDDDNRPLPAFWADRRDSVTGDVVSERGWINAYSHFTDAFVWPRGFPLDRVRRACASPPPAERGERLCPVQQGLANGDPDVDAVYRLVHGGRVSFRSRPPLILDAGGWCPFNSQNTLWFRNAFPLMYLPSHCSFRMTDIWRSLVAQRCLWANGWRVCFHEPTVVQERNAHDLLRDFEQEIPGYLHNAEIAAALEELELLPGARELAANLRACYRVLIRTGLVGPEEEALLDCWEHDLQQAGRRAAESAGAA